MQAYAEGFELMHHSEFELDLSEIAGIWRYGSVVRSWLLELLHEALEQHGDQPGRHRSLRRGLRRGPLDDQRGDQRERAGAGDHVGALRALRLPSGDRLLREGAGGAAEPVRRPRRQGGRRRRRRRPTRGELERRRQSAPRGPAAPAQPGPVRDRHLRRDGRPDAAEDLPRPLRARAPPAAARALRRRRRRPHRADDEAVDRGDEEGGARARPRRVRRARSGASWPTGCATSPPTSPRTKGRTASSMRCATSTSSAAARATGSTTSPSRRPPSRRSSTSSASGGARRAGSG